jgi:putative transposase
MDALANGHEEDQLCGISVPPEVIDHAMWLYLRFTLSFRDVEDLLAERGIAVSYETVRRWVNHFGLMIAAQLRKRRPKPHPTWHLDEVYLKIDGRMAYLWRAVDAEGEVLDVLVQSKRNKHAALKLMRKLLRKYAFVPERLVTDDLRSYGAAARALGLERLHERGRWRNNRAEIRIRQPDDGSARCNASRALALRRNFSQPTPPFATSSTSNAISYQLNRTACYAPLRVARGRCGRLKFRTAIPLRVVASIT